MGSPSRADSTACAHRYGIRESFRHVNCRLDSDRFLIIQPRRLITFSRWNDTGYGWTEELKLSASVYTRSGVHASSSKPPISWLQNPIPDKANDNPPRRDSGHRTVAGRAICLPNEPDTPENRSWPTSRRPPRPPRLPFPVSTAHRLCGWIHKGYSHYLSISVLDPTHHSRPRPPGLLSPKSVLNESTPMRSRRPELLLIPLNGLRIGKVYNSHTGLPFIRLPYTAIRSSPADIRPRQPPGDKEISARYTD